MNEKIYKIFIMKKLFFTSLLLIPFAAGATVTPAANVASTSYVTGAYDTLDTSKQPMLESTSFDTSGSGVYVSSISASSGTVQVTKSDVTLPVGTVASSNRANIWIE